MADRAEPAGLGEAPRSAAARGATAGRRPRAAGRRRRQARAPSGLRDRRGDGRADRPRGARHRHRPVARRRWRPRASARPTRRSSRPSSTSCRSSCAAADSRSSTRAKARCRSCPTWTCTSPRSRRASQGRTPADLRLAPGRPLRRSGRPALAGQLLRRGSIRRLGQIVAAVSRAGLRIEELAELPPAAGELGGRHDPRMPTDFLLDGVKTEATQPGRARAKRS